LENCIPLKPARNAVTGYVPASVAARGSVLQVIAVTTAKPVAAKEQRDSQYPGKPGMNTLNYGMGAKKLGNQIGVSEAEATKKMDQYKDTYKAVGAFFKEAIEETRRTGYAFTVMGRRRNVPEINAKGASERNRGERIATNTAIQGSAADVCRMSQLLIDKLGIERDYGCKMLLQVHDELVFECPKETTKQALDEIQAIMEHPFCENLAVHLGVSRGSGPTWGDAK
jgi:DNA polymerase-1